MSPFRPVLLAICLAPAAAPLSAQSTARAESFIKQHMEKGDSIIEISNTGYELAGSLVLRKTVRSREVVGDKEMESEVWLAAWPLGANLTGKPLYEVKTAGTDAHTRNAEVWIVEDATDPDVPSWSVYTLANGKRLFETYVEPLEFGVSREDGTPRYAGLEVPPDDAPDPRLRAKNVVAVLSYAGADRVVREALVTCDDPERAALLRSYWDEERTLAVSDRTGGRFLRITFRAAYPSPPAEQIITIPLVKDDLDISRAAIPNGIHISPWRR